MASSSPAKTDEITHLYKFRSLSGRAADFVERIFLNSELYFPCPTEFNDPFDCAPYGSGDASPREFKDYVSSLFKRMKPEWSRAERRRRLAVVRTEKQVWSDQFNQILKDVTQSVGLYCLSTRCDNVLMWSHYADSHRGICIRFKASAATPFFGEAQEVKYHADRPTINVVRDNRDERLEKALLRKADFWAYEEEWRIISPDRPSQVRSFPAELLDGVILGAKISEPDKAKVLGWLEQRQMNVQILQAELHPQRFRMIFREI